MNWRECKALLKLKSQVDAMWPGRDKTSDGTIGDTAHAARKSDHNPNAHGVVTAVDIDADLSPTETVGVLVAKLQAGRDPRIKYLIWNGQITIPGDITRWKSYTGANAHKHHCHISASSDPALYDDDREWDLGAAATARASVPVSPPDLKEGDSGPAVRSLQNALISLGFLPARELDGVFGPKTKAAVLKFQVSKQLGADGIAGPDTRAALKL